MTSYMSYAAALAILLSLTANHAYTQVPPHTTQPNLAPRPQINRPMTAPATKARLTDRLHQLTNQYVALKPKALVNVSVRSTHPALKQTQSNIVSTAREIESLEQNVKNQLDSMSEMGETESLRLQMAMDRMSKLMSTLSNLLKKISDTEAGIAQNMK